MRQLAALVIGAIALTCPLNTVQAQNFGGDNSQTESVVYTLELTDQMIEDLRNGQSLRSEIPLHLRNKVTEVRLRFAAGERSANRTYGAPATPPSGTTQPINTNDPFNTGRANPSGFQPSAQGSGNRTDSNRFGQPADSLGDSGSRLQNNIPRFTAPPASTSFGDSNQSSTSRQDDRLVPTTPRYPGGSVSQYNLPLGPPNPYATQSTLNPYATPNSGEMRQPAVSPGGYQPPNRQPASTQGQQPTDNYFPRQPGNSQMRPAAPAGNEFDTANYRQQQEFSDNTRSAAPRDDGGYRPTYQQQLRQTPPQDRFASNQWDNSGFYPGNYQNDIRQQQLAPVQPTYPRNSLVAGQDLPMIPNQTPRTAARPEFQTGQDHVSRSNQDLTASIPGDQKADDKYVAVNDGPNGANSRTPVSQLTQFNNVLFFLLLCSFGLNIYLGWISRGFYVRYRELADELRDTFSTAV